MRAQQLRADFVADFRDVAIPGAGRHDRTPICARANIRWYAAPWRAARRASRPAFTAFVFFTTGAFDHADDEAREIVFSGRVEARHLRRFAADQRASGRVAGARHSLDQLLDHVGIHFRHRQVIEKEERLGAEREDVVDAVIHQVRADRGVNVHGHGDFQFGAHAIGAGDQHRLFPFFIQRKQSAERTDAADHAARKRARCQAPDALLGLIRKRNIHTCFGVVHER